MIDAMHARPEELPSRAINFGMEAGAMRRHRAKSSLCLFIGAAALVACQNDLTAPQQSAVQPRVMKSSSFGCGAQPSRAAVGKAQEIPRLPTVTVTAIYSGGGIPWNLLQQMNFPAGQGANFAPCMNAPGESYVVDTVHVAPADTLPVPVPDGVDADWWRTLSPREQSVMLARAEEMMRLNPYTFPNVGSIMNMFFGEGIRDAKLHAKLRANDFFPGTTIEAELFAGAVYGCSLYRRFVAQSDWQLSNAETLQLVVDLVGALGEAQYWNAPMRGIRFGRNGTFGAGLAFADGYMQDCGWLAFQSVGGAISVSDPYKNSGPPNGGGNGRPYVPPIDDGGNGLPPGWHDQ